MTDASDPVSADRRANWVALRTLRQRPAVVGRTEQGETVYEVRSVRLLLTSGAAHFSQLVHCSKCGRAVAGRAVLTPADLDRTPTPMFCSRCSSGTSPTMPSPRPVPPPPEVAEPVADPPPEEIFPGVDDSRMAVLEAQVVTVMAQVRAMAAAQGERPDVSEALAEIRAQLGRLAQSQDEIDERLVELAAKDAEVVAGVEADRQRLHGVLGEEVAVVRAELETLGRRWQEQESLAAAVDETSARVGELGRALMEMNQRLLGLAERDDGPAADVARQGLDAAQAADLAMLRAELDAQDKRSDERAARQAALEERLDAFVTETSAQLEAHRREAGAELHEVAQDTLGALAEPLRALTSAHEDTERRLESLTAWAGATAARQDALEQKVADALAELRRLAEAEQARNTARRARPPDRAGLLDALEEQLRAAEERLSQQ